MLDDRKNTQSVKSPWSIFHPEFVLSSLLGNNKERKKNTRIIIAAKNVLVHQLGWDLMKENIVTQSCFKISKDVDRMIYSQIKKRELWISLLFLLFLLIWYGIQIVTTTYTPSKQF